MQYAVKIKQLPSCYGILSALASIDAHGRCRYNKTAVLLQNDVSPSALA